MLPTLLVAELSCSRPGASTPVQNPALAASAMSAHVGVPDIRHCRDMRFAAHLVREPRRHHGSSLQQLGSTRRTCAHVLVDSTVHSQSPAGTLEHPSARRGGAIGSRDQPNGVSQPQVSAGIAQGTPCRILGNLLEAQSPAGRGAPMPDWYHPQISAGTPPLGRVVSARKAAAVSEMTGSTRHVAAQPIGPPNSIVQHSGHTIDPYAVECCFHEIRIIMTFEQLDRLLVRRRLSQWL